MAKDRIDLADRLGVDSPERRLARFIADEEPTDRRTLWRLGAWGFGAVAAVTLAIYANQSAIGLRRDQVALAELARQTRVAQQSTQQAQADNRKLASAVETLSGDRDRLYTRVTVLEQGLDSVTGSIGRPGISAPEKVSSVGDGQRNRPEQPPAAAAPATQATSAKTDLADQRLPSASPLMDSRSIMAQPDPAATRFSDPTQPIAANAAAESGRQDASVERTTFGVDLGSASSIDRLRGLWNKLAKSNGEIADLRPLVAIREQSGVPAMQLHLIAGPFADAAGAARICAMLAGQGQACEPAVFDGQRLALDGPATAAPAPRKRIVVKRPPVPPARPRPDEQTSAVGPR